MKQLIFISGRFRSGTSMLWNLFRQLPDTCCWYEPLHPNLISHIQHIKPKQDHLGINDYWQNYRDLKGFEKYYSHSFGQKDLFLEKNKSWPELYNYIEYLIQESNAETVVLQFNRMDLRLAWLKNNFPNAKIIHISRKPQQLWLSSRKHLKELERDNESHPDAYDLMQWSVDLAFLFPMLIAEKNRHSYYRHYFIWKLAQLLAKQHADIHFDLNNDFLDQDTGITQLAKVFNWTDNKIELAKKAIYKPKTLELTGVDSNSFNEIEKEINKLFRQLGLSSLFPSNLLKTIQQEHHAAWNVFNFSQQGVTQELLDSMKYQKDELTALNS